jgi:hypothetical protein
MDFPVLLSFHYYKAASFWSMTKHDWHASCKFVKFAKYSLCCFNHLQKLPLVSHQAQEAVVAFSSFSKYVQLADILC